MRMRLKLGTMLLSGALALAWVGPAQAWQAARTAYATMVTMGDGGSHILGNPAARAKLVEYVSYTCSHCATFSADSRTTIGPRFVAPGNVSVEVRHIIRDPIDLAMAVAANCGSASRFFGRHESLMAEQPVILARVRALPEATLRSWGAAPQNERLRRVADGSGVTDWMRRRGFTPAQINQCFSDTALHERILAMSQAGSAAGVDHTPTFAINGRILPASEAYNWATLVPVLDRAAAAQ